MLWRRYNKGKKESLRVREQKREAEEKSRFQKQEQKKRTCIVAHQKEKKEVKSKRSKEIQLVEEKESLLTR